MSAGDVTPLVLAIDPGRDKCGLALVDGRGQSLCRAVLSTRETPAAVAVWHAEHRPDPVLLGAGTGHRSLGEALAARGIPFLIVPERGTTLRARALYFSDHPPRGLRRLLPRGLLLPPLPIDDYAAVAIALSWLRHEG